MSLANMEEVDLALNVVINTEDGEILLRRGLVEGKFSRGASGTWPGSRPRSDPNHHLRLRYAVAHAAATGQTPQADGRREPSSAAAFMKPRNCATSNEVRRADWRCLIGQPSERCPGQCHQLLGRERSELVHSVVHTPSRFQPPFPTGRSRVSSAYAPLCQGVGRAR